MSDGADVLAGLESQAADTAVLDSPETEVVETEVETPAAEQPQGGELPQDDKQVEADKGGTPGKPNPREISKLIRELRESHPDKAQTLRELNDAYFRAQKFVEHFGSPEDALRAKTTLEALGGDDGIAGLRQRVEFADNIDTMAKVGDPKMIDWMAAESPDGFKKAVPVALDRLQRLDQAAYNAAVTPHLVKSLQATGLADSLQRIAWYANKVDSPELKQEIGQVQRWLTGIFEEDQRRQQTASDPRDAQFARDRETISSERAQIFNEKIGNQVQPHLDSSIRRGIGELAKGTKLADNVVADLTSSVISEIDKTLSGDKVYQSNLQALKAKGNVDAVVRFIKSNVDSVRARITRQVWLNRVAPFQTQKKTDDTTIRETRQPQRQQQPQQRNTQGALLLPSKPNINSLDMDRDPDRQLFITGRGYLKSGPHAGKLVQWRRS